MTSPSRRCLRLGAALPGLLLAAGCARRPASVYAPPTARPEAAARALPALRAAEDAAAGMREPVARAELLAQVAWGFGAAGDSNGLRRALRVAEQAASGAREAAARSLAASYVAEACARRGDVAGARRIALATPARGGVQALARVAAVQASLGDTDGAMATAKLGGEGARDPTLLLAASFRAAGGDVRATDALTEPLLPTERRGIASALRASARAAAGDADAAMAMARAVEGAPEGTRDTAIAEAARAYGRAGRAADARSAARQIGDPGLRTLTLAASIAAAGDSRAALVAARSSRARDLQVALSAVAAGLARRGDLAEARRIAEHLEQPWARNPAWGAVAEALATRGDAKGTLEAAGRTASFFRRRSLRRLARSAPPHTAQPAAPSWLGRVRDSGDRAAAYLGAAEGALGIAYEDGL